MTATTVLRPDRFRCPVCKRWCGEHIATRLLSRHTQPGSGPYELCPGSLHPIKGLPAQSGTDTNAPPYTAPYTQATLW